MRPLIPRLHGHGVRCKIDRSHLRVVPDVQRGAFCARKVRQIRSECSSDLTTVNQNHRLAFRGWQSNANSVEVQGEATCNHSPASDGVPKLLATNLKNRLSRSAAKSYGVRPRVSGGVLHVAGFYDGHLHILQRLQHTGQGEAARARTHHDNASFLPCGSAPHLSHSVLRFFECLLHCHFPLPLRLLPGEPALLPGSPSNQVADPSSCHPWGRLSKGGSFRSRNFAGAAAGQPCMPSHTRLRHRPCERLGLQRITCILHGGAGDAWHYTRLKQHLRPPAPAAERHTQQTA
mmetsp:Transcript_57664/g.137173  ORF Transcript_57664/g.137173 Transcript_57664/m.137173 type:complete len:290 (-) Transcript_57664:63-932(-)